MEIKDEGTAHEILKVRFVFEGHRDMLKTNSPTMRQWLDNTLQKRWLKLIQYLGSSYFQLISLKRTCKVLKK